MLHRTTEAAWQQASESSDCECLTKPAFGGRCPAESWAHLIRKAIRYTLMQSYNAEYKSFLESLLAVFTTAKRSAADLRLKESDRTARVAELLDVLCELCFARY